MSQPPEMSPYVRHIFICTGRFCDPQGEAQALYNRLPALLGEMGDYGNPCRVKRGTTPCLGVCAGGPILVIYPDGVWYHHVDDALLERIVEEHLRDDQPIDAAIFHRLSSGDED
ncbi:MAG: (2Fe-2S) ferredoxin domain-containing protein [Chloroflexota bacterium]